MAEPQRDYTADGQLPIDREIEIAIDSEHPEASLTGLDLNDPRIRIGLGRAMIRRQARLQRFVDEMAAFVRESELAQRPLFEAIGAIEERFADHVRAQRKATGENILTVPGIGIWSSRRQNARWTIDNKLAIEAFGADETNRYTELPVPERKLKRNEYIEEVLDPLLLFDDEKNEIGIDAAEPPTGVERVAGDVSVSYSLNV